MFRRPKFVPKLPAREWLALLTCGVCLGLLLAWLQSRFRLDPRVVRLALLAAAGVLFLWCVLILVAYVKELRREEEEWAGRVGDREDADPE
jgi:CHASE2 domain-containing sensor protein